MSETKNQFDAGWGLPELEARPLDAAQVIELLGIKETDLTSLRKNGIVVPERHSDSGKGRLRRYSLESLVRIFLACSIREEEGFIYWRDVKQVLPKMRDPEIDELYFDNEEWLNVLRKLKRVGKDITGLPMWEKIATTKIVDQTETQE